MKNLSKILAMLLVLTMCMSLFCISAFADEPSALEPDEEIEEVQGGDNQGNENQGNDNQGDENQGNENQGNDNQGNENQGNENQGDEGQGNEAPAAPAAPVELEEDPKEELPVNPLLGTPAEQNSSSSANTFKAAAINFTPSTWLSGSSGVVYGSCEDLKSFKGEDYILLSYSGPKSGVCGVYDWCLSSKSKGLFYLGNSFLNSLPKGDYKFTFTSLVDGTTSGDGELEVTLPDASLWPLETPKHVLGSSSSLSFVITTAPGVLGGVNSGIGYVMVGDVVLVEGRDYYLTDSGDAEQCIITLSPYFLNKLTSGASYKLKVLDSEGNLATSSFSIVGYGTSTSSPRTGDESNIGLWAVLLLLSGTAAVVIVPRIKKHGM